MKLEIIGKRVSSVGMPGKAQDFDGIFAFLFNLVDLFTSVLGFLDALRDFLAGGASA